MTSHRERVRPVKERVGSSARDGDGEGGTNDVYASRILGSRLGRPDGFGCSPVGHAVLDEPLEEDNRIRVGISASLKRDRSPDREVVGSCVFGYFPFVSRGGRGPCRSDGEALLPMPVGPLRSRLRRRCPPTRDSPDSDCVRPEIP